MFYALQKKKRDGKTPKYSALHFFCSECEGGRGVVTAVSSQKHFKREVKSLNNDSNKEIRQCTGTLVTPDFVDLTTLEIKSRLHFV